MHVLRTSDEARIERARRGHLPLLLLWGEGESRWLSQRSVVSQTVSELHERVKRCNSPSKDGSFCLSHPHGWCLEWPFSLFRSQRSLSWGSESTCHQRKGHTQATADRSPALYVKLCCFKSCDSNLYTFKSICIVIYCIVSLRIRPRLLSMFLYSTVWVEWGNQQHKTTIQLNQK